MAVDDKPPVEKKRLFQRGGPGGPGRPRGQQNAVTGEAKRDVLRAYRRLGGARWLTELGKKDPETFVRLLGRLIPREDALLVAAKVDVRHEVKPPSWCGKPPRDWSDTERIDVGQRFNFLLAAIGADLRDLGLPQFEQATTALSLAIQRSIGKPDGTAPGLLLPAPPETEVEAELVIEPASPLDALGPEQRDQAEALREAEARHRAAAAPDTADRDAAEVEAWGRTLTDAERAAIEKKDRDNERWERQQYAKDMRRADGVGHRPPERTGPIPLSARIRRRSG
jgi:hypothetical protein